MDSRRGFWGQAVQKLKGTALFVEKLIGTLNYRKKMRKKDYFVDWLLVMMPELNHFQSVGSK